MRGLDPRIHQDKNLFKKMDCRVKPGNDILVDYLPVKQAGDRSSLAEAPPWFERGLAILAGGCQS
jgi:hypothetical protein